MNLRNLIVVTLIVALGLTYTVSAQNTGDDVNVDIPPPPGVPQEIWNNVPPDWQQQAKAASGFWYLKQKSRSGSGLVLGPNLHAWGFGKGEHADATADVTVSFPGGLSDGVDVYCGTVHWWEWYSLNPNVAPTAPAGLYWTMAEGKAYVAAAATGSVGGFALSDAYAQVEGATAPALDGPNLVTEVDAQATNSAPADTDVKEHLNPNTGVRDASYGYVGFGPVVSGSVRADAIAQVWAVGEEEHGDCTAEADISLDSLPPFPAPP